jgi:hypothetical protein
MFNETVSVGQTKRVQVTADDASGNADPNGIAGTVTYSVSPATGVINITPNAGVANQAQVDCAGVTPGVATVTASCPNEQGSTITGSFTVTVQDVGASLTFSDLGVV